MNAVGVKCIFCGFCLRETELQGHLSGYHNIKSLLLRPNQRNCETQIDPEDRYFIYGQKRYLCDEEAEPEVPAVEMETITVPESISGETESLVEENGNVCARFRCPVCSFVNYGYKSVMEHIVTKHTTFKLNRRRKQLKHKPLRQEMSLKLEILHLPEHIKQRYHPNAQKSQLFTSTNSKENVEPQQPLNNLEARGQRGRPRKIECKAKVSEKFTRRTRSSLPNLESDSKRKTRHSRSEIGIQDNKHRQTKKKQVSTDKRRIERQSKCLKKKNFLVHEEEHEQLLPASVDEDENIVNVLDKLFQEVEEDSIVSVDNGESGSSHDNTLEELDCIILQEVSGRVQLSESEQQELKFIIETSSPTDSHQTNPGTFARPMSPLSGDPGPSRPYQCPYCPSKYDTAVEVYDHVAVCKFTSRVSDDDTSSLSTGVSETARTPPVEVTSNTSRIIKTDNVSVIKSSVTNVYIRFVQTYYPTYKDKFPHLNSADLMEKILEGYKVMRTISHPCIKTLQADYERERKEVYDKKIRAIVRSLEEEDTASFSPIKYSN